MKRTCEQQLAETQAQLTQAEAERACLRSELDQAQRRLQEQHSQLERQTFRTQLAALSPVLRCERIEFTGEQRLDGYEALGLRLIEPTLGAEHWPEFEFRLACARIESEHFGRHLGLEFPHTTRDTALPGWFHESDDAFGPKFELRFAQPDAMDLDVWQRLTEPDRHFITALIEALPRLLMLTRHSGVELGRDWSQWLESAHSLQRILEQRRPDIVAE